MGSAMYREHADTYADWSPRNPVNCYYDRPTILRLAGDLNGKRVLELGCAAGVLTAQLVDRGADVIAVDGEPKLIEHARNRLGTKARFELADLNQPLTVVPTASVDVVTASLVLHYIKDWRPLLADVHRCLVPGGVLVASVHHPITGWEASPREDYHRVELITEQWDWGGVPITAQSYRRPISAIFGDLLHSGFTINAVEEPRGISTPAAADIDPELLHTLTTQPFFLFLRATKTP